MSSLSARRAWIEKISGLRPLIASLTSLSARRAWIENLLRKITITVDESLSARRAWIEKSQPTNFTILRCVALRKESVDRKNIRVAPIDSIIDVALRKESVDRKG